MADESEAAMAMMAADAQFDYAMASSYNASAMAAAADEHATDEAFAEAAAAAEEAEARVASRGGDTEDAENTAEPPAREPPVAATSAEMAARSSPSSSSSSSSSSAPATAGLTTAALFNHELADAELGLPGGDKKTGRPSHPAWDHFVRGSKRNRFHHHAYCRYCTAHGAEAVPVRGVSGNMIRHLQKCIYCPEDIVLQLRVLCAQKDAVNFNKRHQHHQAPPPQLPADIVGGILQASASAAAAAASSSVGAPPGPSAAKKARRAPEATTASSVTSTTPHPVSSTATTTTTASARTSGTSAFSQLQMPASLGRGAAVPAKPSAAAAASARPSKASRNDAMAARLRAQHHSAVNHAALNRLVLRATLSGGIPFDWMSMEEAFRLSFTVPHGKHVALPLRVAVYEKLLVSSLSNGLHETQLARLKDEVAGGLTLTINYWFHKAERTNLMLFSLVNALGEATTWRLLDAGTEDVALEEMSTQIKLAVTALGEEGVSLIAIVTDNLLAYAAAKAAITGGDDPHPPIAVLPSFEAFLVNAMGVILTISESHLETMGNVIELVAAFSNARLRDTLRRECGDSDAALVLPCKDKWFSFIDCIDSLRQFEDMIKIIGLRVVIHQSEVAAAQRGEEPSDAAASAKTAAALVDVPAHVLETIQNPQFWETVVSLSELMSPIKETYKVMLSHGSSLVQSTAAASSFASSSSVSTSSARSSSSAIMTFSLSDVFYQLGRMYQQYTAIIADWEENPSASRVVSHVRYLQEQVNKTWKLYDQPLMFLSYTLNYNMAHPLLARNLPGLQWLSLGKYAKEYFRRWFCVAAGSGTTVVSHRNGGQPRTSTLNEEAATQFLEDVLAFKERKYPFDADSVCDFENPRAFYQLISDSNPLMHLFGSRLFSFATSVPQLSRIVPGKSSVTRVATAACSQDLLLPLLQVNLRARTSLRAQTAKELAASLDHPSRGGVGRKHSTGHDGAGSLLLDGERDAVGGDARFLADAHTGSGIWNDREWRLLAKQWKVEWEHEGNVGNVLDTVAGLNSTSSVSSRLHVELLSLDQIFKEKLPSRLQQSREEEAVVDV